MLNPPRLKMSPNEIQTTLDPTTIMDSSSAEAIVLTAYLKPLVDKHNANELITYEDLMHAHSNAIAALNRQATSSSVRDTLRAIHQQQVDAYKKSAVESLKSWAEEATSEDSMPVWRLVPQSIVDSVKQQVAERASSSSVPIELEVVKEGETEEDGEVEINDEPEEGEEENEGDTPEQTTETIAEDNVNVDKAPSKATEKPKETTKGATKGKPKGGILAKKQAARGKGVNKKVQPAKSPPPQTKRGRPVRKTRPVQK